MAVRHRRRRAGSTACRACCSRRCFAFTPIAFLVLLGVVEGVSPSLEEAAQTLRADRWTTFRTVTLPLMRPGLANAFLVGFIESMADFGNPLVLGGNFDVLSTEIFFAVVGAQHDQGRAAVAGASCCWPSRSAPSSLQRRWLGDAVLHHRLRQGRRRHADAAARRGCAAPCYGDRAAVGCASPSLVYGFAFVGGFVQTWGRDYTPTLDHYVNRLRHRATARTAWSGPARPGTRSARRSKLAAIAAPLTAALGLLTAWLLARQHFAGQRALRVRHDADLRHPRHGDRRRLHPRLQRAADRAHRHRHDHRALLRVPQHAGRRARRHGGDEPDRPQPRRGLADAARPRTCTTLRRVVLPLLRPAIVGRAGLQLRARR